MRDRLEELRGDRQVEDPIEREPGLVVLLLCDLTHLLEEVRVVERSRDITGARQQRVEHGVVGRPPRELLDRVMCLLAELVVRPAGTGAADQVEALGQRALVRQVVDRRHQLALGQVARRAEDDQRRRVDGQPLEPLDERVLGCLLGGSDGRHHSACAGCISDGSAGCALLLTAWPPNWLRSAALTFAANAFWPRELKRSNSDVVMTGIGMRFSIASSTVQRPSPESSTHGSSRARSLPSCSKASAASSHSQERTTEPCIQRWAIFALSSSYSEASNSEKPSAYACIIPYSTPLWTIFT